HSAVANPNYPDFGYANCLVSRRHIQPVSGVLTAAGLTDTLPVAFREGVLNCHVELRERRVQSIEECIEGHWAHGVSITLMKNGVRREHFGDCGPTSFASATRLMSGWLARTAASPSQNIEWSSTARIRILFVPALKLHLILCPETIDW